MNSIIHLVYQKHRVDHRCVLATFSQQFAEQIMKEIHLMDESFMDCIKIDKVRN